MALSNFDEEDGDRSIFAEINVTPLTDIFLVLLIIFMVTQTAIIESAGSVNLPKASQTETESREITVSLTADNQVYVNQQRVELKDLEPTLRGLLAADSQKAVILRGDRAVLLGEAVHVMDIAKSAGANEFSIAAEKETPR